MEEAIRSIFSLICEGRACVCMCVYVCSGGMNKCKWDAEGCVIAS